MQQLKSSIHGDSAADIIAKLNLGDARYRIGIEDFISLYTNKKISDISWIQLCEDVHEFQCYRFAYDFFISLLKNDLYHNEYSNTLKNLLPRLNKMTSIKHSYFKAFFCGEKIDDLFIFYSRQNKSYSYASFSHISNEVDEMFREFLEDNKQYTKYNTREITELFRNSLDPYAGNISTHKDFNDLTFWQQINFYKNQYKNDETLIFQSVITVCYFYRWMINRYDFDIFENSFTITKSLLFNAYFTKLVIENYYFTTYSPYNHPGDKERICFILKGYENYSTQFKNEDFFTLDISLISNKNYREILNSYVISSKSITIAASSGQIYYVRDSLIFLIDIKSQKNYPNPDLLYMTNQEAVFIRNYLHDKNLKLSTLNNRIGAVRRFLKFASDAGMIKLDDLFLNYLSQYEEPTSSTGKSIPEDKLVKLNKYILNEAKTSHNAMLCYVIFHLAIQTEFRISQICNLTIDCIKPSIKPDQYIVYSNSKASNGSKVSYVISGITYHLLMNVIEDTEDVRSKCSIESLKNYIFLYEGRHKMINAFRAEKFSDYLRTSCKELGFSEEYSAANLRDTHMTKAFEHIIRNGKSDMEMSVLSKHKHIDTTKNHYIELELEKMLEATYGITIGNMNLIDIDSKIVDIIPEIANTKEADVEYGCGKCTAQSCVVSSSLPCIICEHFITTVNHEVYFIKAIHNIDRLIEKTVVLHDIEDFQTIKKLYVLYLKSIYKHREALHD